jgi:hypothetical protein
MMRTMSLTPAAPAPRQAPLACRPGCAACCIAPSISTPIPGMPQGKPAGLACVQLDAQARCRLFGQPGRPTVCGSLQPTAEMCGSDRGHAMQWLARLELATAPDQPAAAVPSAAANGRCQPSRRCRSTQT